jgi:hypothetical protein
MYNVEGKNPQAFGATCQNSTKQNSVGHEACGGLVGSQEMQRFRAVD